MSAFRNAVRNGTDMIETDVYLTRDEKIVIFHDKDLMRICGNKGRIEDFDY